MAMDDAFAALLLTALARYFNTYPELDAGVLTCQELAGDLIDTVDPRLLPVRGSAADLGTSFGYDYDI